MSIHFKDIFFLNYVLSRSQIIFYEGNSWTLPGEILEINGKVNVYISLFVERKTKTY